MNDTARLSILCCVGVVTTTIHAEDFKDVVGDSLIGRKTLPIIAPAFTRYSFPFLTVGWSILLCMLWRLSLIVAVAYVALGMLVGYRFAIYNSVKEDQKSFYLYCVSSHFLLKKPILTQCDNFFKTSSGLH